LETDPNLRKKFSDFRFFTNVISSSPLTVASISAEMYGNRDFKLQVETGDELRAFDVPNLITNKLESHGYSVSTYGNYSQEFQNPDRVLLRNEFIDSDLREKTSEVFFFYDFVLVLMGTRYALKAFNKVGIKNAVFYLVGYADSLLRIGRTSTADETILLNKINESKGKNWDRPMIKTIMDYRHYVNGLRVNESSDVAHFLHFSHTHYPVDFDRNCRFRSDDEIWHQLRQNEAGVTDEAYCALTQMAEFLTRLQQLDIYDRSLVVLKSDHGKPALYFDKSQLQSFQIRNQLDWGYNRYTPLLMIKDFDSRAESIDFDDNPAMLDDLARTLCLHSEIKTDCTIYPGFDLLDPDLHISEDTDAVIFIATNSRANSYWRTREALHLQRSKDFYRTLHDALVSELLTEAIACEKPIIFEHNMPFNNGFSDYRSWVAWSEGEARFLKLKLDRCAQVVFVTVQSAADPNGPVFSAAINGRDIGDRITTASPEALPMSTYKIALKPGDGDDNGTILIGLAPAERALPGDFRFVGIEYAPRD
jgi:hypothetical protein